jgi:hypothetical protein
MSAFQVFLSINTVVSNRFWALSMMNSQQKEGKCSSFACTLLLASVVHVLFIAQLLIALPRKSLVLDQCYAAFLPHLVLMYCLPPSFDFYDGNNSPMRLVGKIIDAAPASLLYGFVLYCAIRLMLSMVARSYIRRRKS